MPTSDILHMAFVHRHCAFRAAAVSCSALLDSRAERLMYIF
jgi:hypothetical protein